MHPRHADPQTAHRIPARDLLALLPGLDQRHLADVRHGLAQRLRATPAPTTWQHALNAWTGATPHRPGTLDLRLPRCPDCSHGVSTRNISRNLTRTGHPHICGTCRGTGRGTVLRQPARWAPDPAPDPQT